MRRIWQRHATARCFPLKDGVTSSKNGTSRDRCSEQTVLLKKHPKTWWMSCPNESVSTVMMTTLLLKTHSTNVPAYNCPTLLLIWLSSCHKKVPEQKLRPTDQPFVQRENTNNSSLKTDGKRKIKQKYQLKTKITH